MSPRPFVRHSGRSRSTCTCRRCRRSARRWTPTRSRCSSACWCSSPRLGVGQLIYGPLSDRYGRKAPLYVGLVLFAFASVGCALAQTIETLIIFRFLQGMGACAGHGRAARGRARSSYRRRSRQADVDADAGVQHLADPGAADRQLLHRTLWMAIGLLVRPPSQPYWASACWRCSSKKPGRLRHAPAAASAAPLPPTDACCATGIFSGWSSSARFGIASFFAYLANSPFVLIEHYA